MFLLDTNIWLEVMLGQERADEAGRFMTSRPGEQLHITDFSLHSIGVILTRLKRLATLRDFIADIYTIQVLRLPLDQLRLLPAISNRFRLDFDDAYQYAAARSGGLQFLSFDSDFDRTDLVRRTPQELL